MGRAKADEAGAALLSRQRALSAVADAASVEAARAVAHVAALAWWQASARAQAAGRLAAATLPAGLALAELSPPTTAEARAFGRDLARLPVAEAVAALGRLYTQALPPAHRTSHGIFYTPPALVRRLLDQAEAAGHDWRSGRAIDPSCGGGAFLVEAAARMCAAMDGAAPAIALAALGSRLRGWDLDGFAAWLAHLAVEVVALPLVAAARRRLGPVAEARDALCGFEDAAGLHDLVMGNPPFGKVKDTPGTRARFGRSLYGHPNLYGLFTDLAVHLAKPDGGIIAYLTPASFLAGHYFKALRRLLQEQAPPVSIDLLESRREAFADVLQEVALSTFRRGRAERHATCAVMRAEHGALIRLPTGVLMLPDDPEGPWVLPRSAADAAFVQRMRQMPSRLADWGYAVSTGPLVWNRHKARLHARPGRHRIPIIWAEAVTQDGRFILRATKRNHAPWFEPSGPDDPNIVTRPCILVQRTTAKEQHRRLISAELPAEVIARHGRVTVENHLNMVLPMLRDAGPKVPLAAVAAFLATGTADRVLRCINASVAVSASELEAMPLPTAEELLAALAEPDVEAAIARLYEPVG
ncbi:MULTISPECIES: Eco57I restriction-modification methylase domain-containing protein [Roseomonadaceae]|uniref:site-specific DNA-methyltransferase (adenine-specific) n=1 Tax=Falsiroseomonas oleicola TaxID=2801474 RepID=A0ABS6H849_9PROT|nr:Eco57I restriction-modification methylase domain-containing protein [Roseomonas oleicola]MBU8544875.1 Eco57I restriction-modification methylase domain-containing protein [Roseomonas oleicola]